MNNLRNLFSLVTKNKILLNHGRQYCKHLYEPVYLEGMKSKIPLYDTVNIQLRGYDYVILESFQKLVHNIAKNIDIDVEDGWATPAQDLQIVTYQPKTEIIHAKYNLKVYQRTVQIVDVTSLQMSILLRALEAATPAGVTIEVVPHQDDHEEIRYVPDIELINLKQQLDDMGGPRKL